MWVNKHRCCCYCCHGTSLDHLREFHYNFDPSNCGYRVAFLWNYRQWYRFFFFLVFFFYWRIPGLSPVKSLNSPFFSAQCIGVSGGYSGFQVTGMIEWSQKSRPQKILWASSKVNNKVLSWQLLVIISWLVLRSSFRPGQGTHQRPFCLANSLGITPKVPFANKMMTAVSPYIACCHHFVSERDFGRDAQRVCQAERSLMSPLAGTKRAS